MKEGISGAKLEIGRVLMRVNRTVIVRMKKKKSLSCSIAIKGLTMKLGSGQVKNNPEIENPAYSVSRGSFPGKIVSLILNLNLLTCS